MQNAIDALNTADKIIKKRHRYTCGLEAPAVAGTSRDSFGEASESPKDRMRTFFLSPDGQNGELYYELLKLGFRHSKYDAEYYWKVRNAEGWLITYTEGDVDIYKAV